MRMIHLSFLFVFSFCRKIFIKIIRCGFNALCVWFAQCTFDVMDKCHFHPLIRSFVWCMLGEWKLTGTQHHVLLCFSCMPRQSYISFLMIIISDSILLLLCCYCCCWCCLFCNHLLVVVVFLVISYLFPFRHFNLEATSKVKMCISFDKMLFFRRIK